MCLEIKIQMRIINLGVDSVKHRDGEVRRGREGRRYVWVTSQVTAVGSPDLSPRVEPQVNCRPYTSLLSS